MKNLSFKRGLLLSLVVSAIATSPRLMLPGANHAAYLAGHLLYLFVLALLCWLPAQSLIDSKRFYWFKTGLFLVGCGFISLAYHLIAQQLFSGLSRIYADFPFIDPLPLPKKNLMLFLRGATLGAVIYFIEYYFHVLFERQKASLEIEQLKKERLEAQLNSLKQQISPHFLFNSLSTLQTIVSDLPSKKYVQQLSNVYRYLLTFNENNVTSLKAELEFIHSYLYILKERFEDGLHIEININDQLLDKELPPLVLQLLVENAIKHNIVSLDEPLLVEIFNEGDSRLVVRNKLQPRISAESSTGKGLGNIAVRYQLLSGKNIEILRDEIHFTVAVPLIWNVKN
jgi:sensor histidine kinase YesM